MASEDSQSTQYQSLPISTPKSDSEWDKVLESVKERRWGCMGPNVNLMTVTQQIDQLDALPPGSKLYLYQQYESYSRLFFGADLFLKLSIANKFVIKILGVIVPILIQFSQTYKDTVVGDIVYKPLKPSMVALFGANSNLGAILSFFAICLSLGGTMVQVYLQQSKFSETSLAQRTYAMNLVAELRLFVTMSGPYADCHDELHAYRAFVEKTVALEKQFQIAISLFDTDSPPQPEAAQSGNTPPGSEPGIAGTPKAHIKHHRKPAAV